MGRDPVELTKRAKYKPPTMRERLRLKESIWMEAMMILDCSDYSENIVDVLKIFQQIGWDIYNPHGKVEFLPIGDGDEYDWQCKEISESELYDIISKKMLEKNR